MKKIVLLFSSFVFMSFFSYSQVPTATNSQILCTGSKVSDLQATLTSPGTALLWYDNENGNISLNATDLLSTGTYYVAQSNPTIVTDIQSNIRAFGIDVDASNRVLFVDIGSNSIKRINSDGTGLVTLTAALNSPRTLVVEPNGKILFTESNGHSIKRMDANGTNIVTVASGLFHPNGITLQADGKILFTDAGNTIKRIEANGTNMITLATFPHVDQVKVQPDGKILGADYSNATLYRMDADGTNIVTLNNTMRPYGLDVQADGKILVTDNIDHTLKRMDADGTNIETLATGLNFPRGVVIDNDGNFVFSQGFTTIKKLTHAHISNRVAVNVTIGNLNTEKPTTTLNTQIFTASKTLADLEITGQDIKWYNAATEGNLLPNTTIVGDNVTYYATQTINCDESTTRLAITTKNISAASQHLCINVKVTDLITTPSSGYTLQWYNNLSQIEPLPSTNVLTNGPFYVEQVFQPMSITASVGSYVAPRDIALSNDDKIWLVESQQLKKMNLDGSSTEVFSSNGPRAIAIQPDGKILVADVFSIYRINADGTNKTTIINDGNVNGIAILPDESIIYVTGNSVRKMDKDGNNNILLASVASPIGLAVEADGKILVVDYVSSQLKRMNSDGSNIVTLGSGFNFPSKVAVLEDGSIIITDTGNKVVKKMNADGTNIKVLSTGYASPKGVAIKNDGTIFITDNVSNDVKKINSSSISNRALVNVTVNPNETIPTGKKYQVFSSPSTLADFEVSGTVIQWYSEAVNGTLLPNNTPIVDDVFYYADITSNGCDSDYRFVVSGKVISAPSQIMCPQSTIANLTVNPSPDATISWYETASGGSPLATNTMLSSKTYYVSQHKNIKPAVSFFDGLLQPSDIVAESNGNLLVADTGNNQIKRFSPDGTLEVVANISTSFIAVDNLGRIVYEAGTNINRMNADGSNIETVVSGINSIKDIAFQSDGSLIVLSGIDILKINADGTNVRTILDGSDNGLSLIYEIAIAPDDIIYISDESNHYTIKRADANGGNLFTRVGGSVADPLTSPSAIIIETDGAIIYTHNDKIYRLGTDNSGGYYGTVNGPKKITVLKDSSIVAISSNLLQSSLFKIERPKVSNRLEVAVTVSATATIKPVATALQTFNIGETIADLNITGTAIKWYDAATDGNLLANNTVLVNDSIYYASQTLNNCESERLEVTVKSFNWVGSRAQEFGTNDFRISDAGGIGNSSIDASDSDIAYNTLRNEYLVVWKADDTDFAGFADNKFQIIGQIIDANGAEVGVDFMISNFTGSDNIAETPSVAYNSVKDEYLVVWSGGDGDPDFDTNKIYGQRISATGTSIGSNIEISTTFFNWNSANTVVSYSKTRNQYFVVWVGNSIIENKHDIYGMRISHWGTRSSDEILISTSNTVSYYDAVDPQITYNSTDNEYLVVWTGDISSGKEEIYGQRFNAATGAANEPFLGTNFRISNMTDVNTGFDAITPNVIYNETDNQYLVIWGGDVSFGKEEVFGQLLSNVGVEIGSDFQITTHGGDNNVDAKQPDVAWSATTNSYMVAWYGPSLLTFPQRLSTEIWMQEITNTGILSGAIIKISDFTSLGYYESYNPKIISNTEQGLLISWHSDGNSSPANINTAGLVNGEKEIFIQMYGSAAIWTGTTNTDWNTSTNWKPNFVPTATSSSLIPNVVKQPIISSSTAVVAKDISIEASSSLTIDAGGALTIDGNLTQYGTLTVNSDATKSGSLAVKGTATGNITYNRYVTDNWHTVGAPVIGQNINDFAVTNTATNQVIQNSDNTKYAIAPYNNDVATNNWEYILVDDVASAGNFVNGKGYSMKRATAGSYTFTGAIENESKTVTLDVSSENNWNLIANPYPSFLKFNNLSDAGINLLQQNATRLHANNLAVYIWDKTTVGYKPYNHASSNLPFLAPGQAFFVRAKDGGSTFTFDKSMQTHHQQKVFAKAQNSIFEINLKITDGKNTKSTEIKYLENTTKGLDVGYDAQQFSEQDNSFNVFTNLVEDNNNGAFALQCLPPENFEDLIIPIGVNVESNTSVNFSIDANNIPTGINIYIEDKQEGKFTKMNTIGSSYQITLLEPQNGTGHFYLHTTNQVLSTEGLLTEFKQANVWLSDKRTIKITNLLAEKATLKLFDLLGKEVLIESLEATKNAHLIDLPKNIKSGVYLVKLITNNRIQSVKIFIE